MTATDHSYDHNEETQILKSDHKDPTKLTSNKTGEWPLSKTIIAHKPAVFLYLYLILFIGFFFSRPWINTVRFRSSEFTPTKPLISSSNLTKPPSNPTNNSPNTKEFQAPLTCSNTTAPRCPISYYPTNFTQEPDSSDNRNTCPEYFRWISEDLKPWMSTGISLEMVEAAKSLAYFRLVVVNGRVYVEKYKQSFQTRDVFTIWGILQLLRLYQGRLPDLDLMFECNDLPTIIKDKYKGPNASFVPPLFHYCGDDFSYDIVFPDWSFWGWPEINIKPWNLLAKDMEEGNRKIKWVDRAPYAYWKGNLRMCKRYFLAGCNSIEQWGAQIYRQNWGLETKHGFRTSNLAEQCTHRYKIYMEGRGWSVSEKYIQACDSMMLMVQSRYYEFFTRSLVPMKHYWPLGNLRTLCQSIKEAVLWGNTNPDKAQEIGRAGSKFVMEDLKMQNVYDYMFHLLNEYSKLLRYKPTIPAGAVEMCSESMACSVQGREKEFKIDSLTKAPSKTSPCIYDMHNPQLVQDNIPL